MCLCLPAAHLPHPLGTVPLLLGVAQLLVRKLGPRTVLVVFVNEHAVAGPPPTPTLLVSRRGTWSQELEE